MEVPGRRQHGSPKFARLKCQQCTSNGLVLGLNPAEVEVCTQRREASSLSRRRPALEDVTQQGDIRGQEVTWQRSVIPALRSADSQYASAVTNRP